MATTYYAWSPIRVANEKAELSTIAVGDTVTKADVGGDEAWDSLIEANVVRTQKVPQTTGDESPKQAVLRQAQAMVDSVEDGDYSSPEVVEAMNQLQPPAPVSDATPKSDKDAGK